MAEIRDTYSLEFDSAAFESQLQSAINQVNELSAAIDDSATSTGDLDSAVDGLVKTLKTEANTTQDLNTKRNILVKTQNTLNKESRAYNSVSQQVVTTNRQIAVSTGQATTAQRSFFGNLVAGAQRINSLRRAASVLGGVLRVVAGISIGGLLTAAIPAVIGLFGRLFNSAKEVKSELDKLNDPGVGLGERQQILRDEIARLDAVGRRNGELTDEQKQQRDELVQKYKETNEQIEKSEQDRIDRIFQYEVKTQQNRIKLLGNTAKAIFAQSALSQQELFKQTTDDFLKLQKEQDDALRDAAELRRKGRFDDARAAQARADAIAEEIAALVAFEKSEKAVIEQEAKGNATRLQQQQILATSLAALEKELARLKKIQAEQTDALSAEAVQAIQLQIDKQQEQVDKAKALLADIQGVAKARENIERLNTELITNEYVKREKELRAAAAKEIAAVVGTEEQKAEQIRLINEGLNQELAALTKKRLDEQAAAEQEAQQATIKRIESALAVDQSLEQTRLNVALQGIESRRNAELQAAANTITDIEARNKAVEEINKRYDAERLAAEKRNQIARIQAEIQAVQNIIEIRSALGESTADETAKLEELRLKLIELQREDQTIEVDADTKSAGGKLKELVKLIASELPQVSNAIFDGIKQGYDALISRLDEAVNRSKTALDEIRQNSENFNARQLQLEKERLEKLEAERRRAVEREQALSLIQLTFNSLVAISKAAAEGGIAAPFTIAATIASLIAGFAAARAAASNAFFHGTEYVDRENRYPSGRDTVPARLHKGERVITTATNREYWQSLSAIHHHRVPAGVLNNFVQNWDKPQSAIKQIDGKLAIIAMPSDNSKLIAEIASLKELIAGLTPTNVYVNANSRGIFKTVERHQKMSANTRRIVNR